MCDNLFFSYFISRLLNKRYFFYRKFQKKIQMSTLSHVHIHHCKYINIHNLILMVHKIFTKFISHFNRWMRCTVIFSWSPNINIFSSFVYHLCLYEPIKFFWYTFKVYNYIMKDCNSLNNFSSFINTCLNWFI